MINLLPDPVKRDIHAARMNVVLLRYNIIVVITIAVLALFCLTFYLILHNNQSDAVSSNSDNKAKAQTYSDVNQEATAYSANLSIARKIFANAINYTDIVNQITKLIPNRVVLDNIELNEASFGAQDSFSAHAKDYDAATKLKQNFQSSTLFSNVYFQSLTVSSDASNKYPVTIVLSAKLNKMNNPQ